MERYPVLSAKLLTPSVMLGVNNSAMLVSDIMSQVIIVSNRLPISVKKEDGELVFSSSVGGLATGLSSYANDKHNIWIGWPGIPSDDLTGRDREQIVTELAKHHCSPVFLTRKQIDDFYNGYSNTVLWPLFHKLRPQDKAGERREKWYRSYRTVNKLFAEATEAAAQKGSRVWVHDYQLLLVPEMLQHMNLQTTIGFFLHIPFPDPKKFMSLAGYRKLITGMLGADLVGFHTPGYVENFLKTCEKAGIGTVSGQTVTVGKRTVRVSDFPMGIDYEKYAGAGRSKVVKQSVKNYRRQYRGKKVIVAVDRLDPSKGLLERLQAYRELLHRYPKLHGKVVFVMVAAPSRTDVPAYQRLAKRLDQLVQSINLEYGNTKWQPVDYINRTVPFEEVTALFQVANVAFIAPLRDGMNLAAKEFIASARKNSVLILSETAGAAAELRDALLVNPNKPETVIKALHDSLSMGRFELRRRLKRMKYYLKDHTVQNWAKDFVDTLNRPVPGALLRTYTLTPKRAKWLQKDFDHAHKRLLLLDYDGTLVPFHSDYRNAEPSERLRKLIIKLAHDPANDVVIISGRGAADLEKWFGMMPVNLVAEHGASFKRAASETWEVRAKDSRQWKELLLPVLEKYAALTPGAKVEVKPHSLVWHYRSSPPYYAQKYLVIIKRSLQPFLRTYGIEIVRGNKVLEIKDPHASKDKAAQIWLQDYYDFVLGVGDDTTDEDLFGVLPEGSYGIKVGSAYTAAPYRVASYREILDLLSKLAG